MRFFFYGTLVQGSSNAVASDVHRHLKPTGQASAAGSLHAVPDADGWYPALLPGEGVVHGFLYDALPGFSADLLARMDAYEDFDPAQPQASLYVRREVLTDGGHAQAYLFNQPLPANARPIRDGDFRAWLKNHNATPFAGGRSSG